MFFLALRKFCGFCVLILIFQAHFVHLQNGHSEWYARVIAVECGPRLFMVTTLLVFLYFLGLPWACVFYCFLKLNIAFYFFIDLYMSKQNLCVFFFPILSLDGSLGVNLPKTYHFDGSILKVIQCTSVNVIIWYKFSWYMVMLIRQFCIVIIYIFFWVCIWTFYLHQCRLGLNKKILSKNDTETVSDVIMKLAMGLWPLHAHMGLFCRISLCV